MQISSSPDRSARWRSLLTKLLIGLVGTSMIASIILFSEFNPPMVPEPPVYRITPGISGLGFFNASCGQRDSKQGYSYRFAKRDARCIYAELHLPPNMPETTLHVIFYDVEGQVLYEENLLLGRVSSTTIAGVYEGQDEPGHWLPGMYHVEFIVEGEIIAADTFQITDP